MSSISKKSRDDFTLATTNELARRVGNRCSNPNCRRPTLGPQVISGTVNTGVAAHITGASSGGPRYNEALNSSQRKSSSNGIWLCQVCAKTIDSDLPLYTVESLNSWKVFAENAASIEQQGFSVVRGRSFAALEDKLTKLTAEMRSDLERSPLVREFIVLSKGMSYNGTEKRIFQYFFEDHQDLLNQLQIFVRYCAIFETTYNNVDRYEFEEDFIDYLIGNASPVVPLQSQ